jgi:hypothetical protein
MRLCGVAIDSTASNCLAQAFGDEIINISFGVQVFHGLRKTCAGLLAEAGAATKPVGAITGQSDQMVSHYAKLAERGGLARQAITKLEQKLPDAQMESDRAR